VDQIEFAQPTACASGGSGLVAKVGGGIRKHSAESGNGRKSHDFRYVRIKKEISMSSAQASRSASNRRSQSESRELDPAEVGRDLVEYLREYARENPETAALWCFGIGFVLGWKLKIW